MSKWLVAFVIIFIIALVYGIQTLPINIILTGLILLAIINAIAVILVEKVGMRDEY